MRYMDDNYNPYDDQDVYDGEDNTMHRCVSCDVVIDLEDIEGDEDNCPLCGEHVFYRDGGYEPREFPSFD